MPINPYYPETQVQSPDLLGSYLRGAMAPGMLQGQQQQLQAGALDLDQLRQSMAKQQFINETGERLVTSGLNGQGSGSGGGTGGIQDGPQGAVATPYQASPPSANAQRGLAILQGKYSPETEKNIFDNQKQQVQFAAKGPMDLADTVASSPNAAQIILNNPSLQQQWLKIAPQLGLNPFKDLTDDNARAAARFGYNQLAGQAGLDSKPMPTRLINKGIQQIDPLSGKVEHEEELQQVVGQNGQPTLVPRNQAVGMQPFNASVFGASNVSDQAVQFAADTYRTTGKMPASLGRNPAMQAKILDRVAQDASANGDSAAAIAARTAARGANTQALTQITKTETATKAYYETLDKNLTNLQELAGKVDASGSPLVNKVYMAYKQGVAGDPDVAKYVTYLNSAASEFAKIQSGSLGNAPVSDAARKHADDVINKFMSQGQISAVAEAMRGEGNNRLTSIQEEKQSLMGGLSAPAPGQAAPPSPAAVAKTVTQAQVSDYAQKHGLSQAAALAHVQAAGFTVQ